MQISSLFWLVKWFKFPNLNCFFSVKDKSTSMSHLSSAGKIAHLADLKLEDRIGWMVLLALGMPAGE